MDLHELRSFQVLAEELVIPAAARRLHLSESTVTKRVQRLEQRLGVQLFEQTPRMALTHAGVALLSRVSSVMEEWQSAADYVHVVADGGPLGPTPETQGAIRLAVPKISSGALQPYLSAVLPAHEVTVTAMAPGRAWECLDAAEGVDAVLVHDPVGLPIRRSTGAAHGATVVVEPLWVMVGTRHRLADQDEVSIDDVVAHGFPWIVDPPDVPARLWQEAFLLSNAPRAQLRDETLRSHTDIARGHAVTLATPVWPPNDLLTVRRLTPVMYIHMSLFWHPDRVPAALAEQLFAEVRGFYRRCAQRNPRYWRWICDHPDSFPGIAPDPSRERQAVAPAAASGSVDGLSPREREVLTLVAAGFNDAEIAQELQVSPLTAKAHVVNIRGKLGARDRVQLVVFAYQQGLTG